MTSHIDTDTLRETLAAATPGPWEMVTVRTSCGLCHKVGPFPHPWKKHGTSHACVYDDHPPPEGTPVMVANARLAAMAPDIAAETLRLRDRVEALEGALRAVIDATRAYLPPDGIDARDCIGRVIAATDNPKINATMGGGDACV